ncbi:LysE family translocator [Vibrio sp. WXL103]|uniref:LysE family translocator n=1 Tax=Vibrio sp. WXL103 TaxID=3450710 RepID=UPI003EC73BE3
MLDIILYALGVMYTPGPVNAICLNSGIQKQHTIVGFCCGVSVAMFLLFGAVSWLGETLISDTLLRWTAILGSAYVIWLAYQIFQSSVNSMTHEPSQNMTFGDGAMLQLLNPKGITVVLPIATVQFPNAGITGVSIFVWCALLAAFAFGAPLAYYILGRLIGQRINDTGYLNITNKILATLLLVVGIRMGLPASIDLFS